MNKKQMVTITKQESECLLANGKILKYAFRGLVRPHDNFTGDIMRNERKTFARQRKLDTTVRLKVEQNQLIANID